MRDPYTSLPEPVKVERPVRLPGHPTLPLHAAGMRDADVRSSTWPYKPIPGDCNCEGGYIVHPPSAYDRSVGESRRLHTPCPVCQTSDVEA